MEDKTSLSILIVDDEKSNLEILNSILKKHYTIYVAKTGKAALDRARDESPDLILLDVIMPDMDGFEVLTKLKESDITRDIPVIFITGLDSVEDEENGFKLGAVDYITKPFNSSIVKARVNTHLKIVEQMRTIERLGLIDVLTNIPNRRSFDTQMSIEWNRSIRESMPISILMIDLDKFKSYNDTYGHTQGDVLLKNIANIFVSTLRRMTDLVFRWGGEEFAVILPNTCTDGAKKVAENIRQNVESAVIPNMSDNRQTSITVSIGVSTIMPSIINYKSITELISEADNVLYEAKKTGRNKVCSCLSE